MSVNYVNPPMSVYTQANSAPNFNYQQSVNKRNLLPYEDIYPVYQKPKITRKNNFEQARNSPRGSIPVYRKKKLRRKKLKIVENENGDDFYERQKFDDDNQLDDRIRNIRRNDAIFRLDFMLENLNIFDFKIVLKTVFLKLLCNKSS